MEKDDEGRVKGDGEFGSVMATQEAKMETSQGLLGLFAHRSPVTAPDSLRWSLTGNPLSDYYS